jgi:hypothetical protein
LPSFFSFTQTQVAQPYWLLAQHGVSLVELLRLRAVLDERFLGIGETQVEVALDLLAPARRLRPVS